MDKKSPGACRQEYHGSQCMMVKQVKQEAVVWLTDYGFLHGGWWDAIATIRRIPATRWGGMRAADSK